MGFEAQGAHGTSCFRVQSVGDEMVVADFNHPLAGERLHFDVKVVEVREPSPDELASLSGCSCCNPDTCGGCS
jgi:FKBP-type peptidyl-prolyl cis-trans isomerase SlyD